MIHENIELTGSFIVSGSFVLPSHPNTGSVTALTGSMYHDTTDNILKVYTGNAWKAVGEQTGSAGVVAASADIEYLLVAGGGGGGEGGGGAGGFLSSSLSSVESGSSFTVTVGSGGSGGASDASGGQPGTNGNLSSIAGVTISTVTSVAGGGGGGYNGANVDGYDGGSGGGGRRDGASSGGVGTTGQGNDGGTTTSGPWRGAGGGGGKSTDGSAGSGNGASSGEVGGTGGTGLTSTITGTSVTYAGGGGGGYEGTGGGGTGGTGGGGNGGGQLSGTSATSGTTNTGGGGGGTSKNSSTAGSGGSGVAIFAYPSSSASGIGGIKTARSDGYVVHTFNSSGTLTIGGANDYSFPIASSNFGIVTYTGNNNTQTFTSLNFQPDMIWAKDRGGTYSHALYDVVRTRSKMIRPNDSSDAERNVNVGQDLVSFDSSGFTLGSDHHTVINANSRNYVTWCWKAGGAAVSNTQGTITSQVSANVEAGFSISTYTGNGVDGATVGHGLSSTPELSIIKKREGGTDWDVTYYGISGGTSLNLNETTAVFSPTQGYHTQGSTTFTLRNGGSGITRVNTNSSTYVAYHFHSVGGYQKIGTYTGTSAVDNVITTGFRPKFVLIKGTHTGAGWRMLDSARGTDKSIRANIVDAEYDDSANYLDFENTGFAFRSGNTGISNSDLNGNGNTYLYLAIAE